MTAILLIAPNTTWGRMVDAVTGGLGWSHVVLDADEEDESGEALWWDCTPKKGIHRVRASESKYRDREFSRIELAPQDGLFVQQCAEVCQGRRYSSKDSCASWIIRCLPPHLEVFAEVAAERFRLPLCPNVLAIAFGVEHPGDAVYLGRQPA